ncbi:histidine kinase [Clostridiales bacterium oral taxon 876 str. F0540]|nr:histidine kinase [Clostridiales bacterium oral taxon 876 str. F0540]
MKKLIDKLVIFIVSAALYIPNGDSIYTIIPILISIIISAIISYIEDERITIAVFFMFLVLCFFRSDFLFFIPLICYDAVYLRIKALWILSSFPLIANITNIYQPSMWMIASLIIVSFILKYRTASLLNVESDYYKLRDTTKEISLQLEKQNKELIEKQDSEVHLATLRERNRIARDIHDNVGHLLSRSILQIGALMAINKDIEMKENLRLLKDTLSEAMDSIRSSVHDLHEESIDLHTEIEKLLGSFTFCPVKFDYDIDTNLDKNIKYTFIAIAKEALSNIIKHSNATEASIIVREHPALYQLVIQDNGSQTNYNSENGIGIKNISDRVSAIGGNVNISTDKGFRIFISVPKKKSS